MQLLLRRSQLNGAMAVPPSDWSLGIRSNGAGLKRKMTPVRRMKSGVASVRPKPVGRGIGGFQNFPGGAYRPWSGSCGRRETGM
jgi:hypothetical protein